MKDDEGVKLSGTQSWWCSLFFSCAVAGGGGVVFTCAAVVVWLGGCVCDRGAVLLTRAYQGLQS